MIKREDFRKLKAALELDVFRKKDNNNIYLYQDSLIKIEYPLNEEIAKEAYKDLRNKN